MFGEEQFDQHSARVTHARSAGLDVHAGLNRPDTRRREDPRAHVHNAHAADADRRLVLLMTERGDANRVQPCRIENGGSRRHGNFLPVNREFDLALWAHACRAPPARASVPEKHTPDGHSRRAICASTSCRKCFKSEATGAGKICPSPQMEVSRNVSESCSTSRRSASNRETEVPPRVHAVSSSTIFCEPTRHGTHLPQDSLR